MNRFVMAAAVIENILYFSDRYSNGLYQLNLDDGESTFIDYFFNEKAGEMLYLQAYIFEKKIYFIPGLAENIACFDTISKEITYIDLPPDGIVLHGVDGIFAEKFRCQRKENILWMMPVGYNLFLRLDLSNERLMKIKMPDCLVFEEGIFNWRTSCLDGEKMIFQPWAGTIQVHYNITSGDFELEKFEEGIRTYKSYLRAGIYEIYVPLKLKYGLLVKSVIDKKKEVFKFNSRMENCTCTVAFLIKNQLYLMPEFGNNMVIVTIPNFDMEYIDLNEKLGKNYASWELIDMAKSTFKYYILSSTISEILEIDQRSGDMKLIEIKEENYESKKWRIDRCINNLNKKVFQENRKRILYEEHEELEQLIVQMYNCSINGEQQNFCFGKIIYEKLRGDLR